MSSDPLVSILIPTYNVERHVAAAVESVLSQSYSDIEIIVVDDGSTDGTWDVLSAYDGGPIQLFLRPNQGAAATRNHAFSLSNGDLIKFFDADDILDLDHVRLQVERLDNRRDAIAMGEWARFYGDNPDSADFEPLPMYRDAAPVDWLTSEWMSARPMTQPGMFLIPRLLVEKAGGWDERLSLNDDFEFFARVLLNCEEILYTPGARLRYRSGLDGSLSGQKSRKAVESAFNSLIWGTQHLLDAESSERTRRASANLLQDFVYTYYPNHKDLLTSANERIEQLGGSDLAPDGPPKFQLLRGLIGWRLARRIEHLARRK